MKFTEPPRPSTINDYGQPTKRFSEYTGAEKVELVDGAAALCRFERLQQDLNGEGDLPEPVPVQRRMVSRREYHEARVAEGTLGNQKRVFELAPPPPVLAYDKDIALTCGSIRAAVFVKLVEIQIRHKIEEYGLKDTDKLIFWESREKIARHLGMSIQEFRAARDKAEKAGVSWKIKGLLHNPCDRTSVYYFRRRKEFFKGREKAKMWRVRADELDNLGEFAAALLGLYRRQITDNIVEDLKNGVQKPEGGKEADGEITKPGYAQNGTYWRHDRVVDLVESTFGGLFNRKHITRGLRKLVDQQILVEGQACALDQLKGKRWFAFPPGEQAKLEEVAKAIVEKDAQKALEKAENGSKQPWTTSTNALDKINRSIQILPMQRLRPPALTLRRACLLRVPRASYL